MENKKYKEVIINSIHDVEKGDVIFDDKTNDMGLVIHIGNTLIHDHKFAKVVWQSNFEREWNTDKQLDEDFEKGDIVLRKKD